MLADLKLRITREHKADRHTRAHTDIHTDIHTHTHRHRRPGRLIAKQTRSAVSTTKTRGEGRESLLGTQHSNTQKLTHTRTYIQTYIHIHTDTDALVG